MSKGASKGATEGSEVAICNLLYRYAEMMDEGRFEDLAVELYRHCSFVVGDDANTRLDGGAMVQLICRTTVRYPDGTPRTKHVITNPIIEVEEEAGTAICRSNYVVFQRTETLPLQAIVAGRYRDRFERVDGEWRFSERDYSLVDMVGDVSQHLRFEIKPAAR